MYNLCQAPTSEGPLNGLNTQCLISNQGGVCCFRGLAIRIKQFSVVYDSRLTYTDTFAVPVGLLQACRARAGSVRCRWWRWSTPRTTTSSVWTRPTTSRTRSADSPAPRWVIQTHGAPFRVPSAQGKPGKWSKNSLSGKTEGIWEFYQNTWNFVCISCKFPDSKGKGHCGICLKKKNFFFLKLDMSAT